MLFRSEQNHLVAVVSQRVHMISGQRRAQRRHHIAHAVNGQGKQIEIALDHQRAPSLPDGFPMRIEAEELDWASGSVALVWSVTNLDDDFAMYALGETKTDKGIIVGEGGGFTDAAMYTDSDVAIRFIQETGIDALAVSYDSIEDRKSVV